MTPPFLHILQTTFAERAGHRALVHEHRTFTYGDLTAHAREGAGWLQSLGVRKGDRVVLCTDNKRAFLFAHLASLFAGAVSLPLNPRFTREELRYFLKDSGASVAIVGGEARDIIEGLQPELPTLQKVVPDVAVLDSPKRTYKIVHVTPADPCLILYSSGTTGWPKGVVHTHGNVASSLLALKSCWRFTPDDVVLNVLPLFHIHGLCFATQLTWLTGGCLLVDEFEAKRTLERMPECTVFMAVPTIYYRFLDYWRQHGAATAGWKTRLFTCGSAPIRAEVLPELEGILGKPIINRYGMSEAFVISSLPLDGPWPHGSVGKPLDGIELRIAAEAGTTTGAVQIRGPNLFRQYWNMPDATRDAFASGWFDTGDVGTLDGAGFLTLIGRKNDLIITSGYNVYPQVVERVINECPGVRESAVFGVPDEHKGERVVAVVVRDDAMLDEGRVQAYLRDRLVDYQRPRAIVFVEALPRNAMGKVLRRDLRALI